MKLLRFFSTRYRLARRKEKVCGENSEETTVCNYIRSFNDLAQDTMPILVLDTETTGLSTKKDSILSIGVVPVEGHRIKLRNAYERFIAYDDEQSHEAIEIHGILPSTSAGGVALPHVLEELLVLLKSALLVAHHAVFDRAMLDRAFLRHFGIMTINPFIDTMHMAIKLEYGTATPESLPQGRFTLDSLCARYEIPMSGRHTALGDAMATAQLYCVLDERLRLKGYNRKLFMKY